MELGRLNTLAPIGEVLFEVQTELELGALRLVTAKMLSKLLLSE